MFQAKCDIQKDIDDLTRRMFQVVAPMVHKLPDSFWEMASTGLFNLPKDGDMSVLLWDQTPLESDDLHTNDMIALYSYLKGYITTKLERIGTPLLEERGQIDSPLPLLVKQNQELDRYNELLEICFRADEKLSLDKETIPQRIIKPTELKVIKLLRKMGNRPLFTTAASLW